MENTTTLTCSTYYTTKNFPFFVTNHGNWDIYRNANGYCAAIPVVEGCNATHFGDWNYTRLTLSLEGIKLPVDWK